MPRTRPLSWLTILYWPFPADTRDQTCEVLLLAVAWTAEVPHAVPAFSVSRRRPLLTLVIR